MYDFLLLNFVAVNQLHGDLRVDRRENSASLQLQA